MTHPADTLREIKDLDVMTHKIGEYFTSFTGIELTACDFLHARRLTLKGKIHSPSSLRKDKEQGVYVFIVDYRHCLKVGYSGPKSQSRWNTQHYTLNTSVSSTLTKSILNYSPTFTKFLEDTDIDTAAIREFVDILHDAAKYAWYDPRIREWLETYTSRMEFKFSADESKFAGTFLESSLHYLLHPLYEG